MTIPTILPESTGTINQHVVAAVARMRHENTPQAVLLVEGVPVTLYQTSDIRDAIEKWSFKKELIIAGIHKIA